MGRSVARSRATMLVAAMAVSAVIALGGALPAGGTERPDGTGSGLGAASGDRGTWADAPAGAADGPLGSAAAPSPTDRSGQLPPLSEVEPDPATTGTIEGRAVYAATDEQGERPGYDIKVELDRSVGDTDDFETVTFTYGPDFRFDGLEPGRYRLHFVDEAQQNVRNEYYDSTPYDWDADVISVEAGQVVGGIVASLNPWGVYTYRYGGDNRYDVAALISTLAFEPGVPVLYIASGEKFPDALSAGPAAAHQRGAMLLVQADSVPKATRSAIDTLKPQKIVIVGGEASVSARVYSQLSALQPNIERIGGADRYEVSRNVIDYAFCGEVEGECADGAATVFAASGANFPDALSAGPAAAHVDGAVLLVPGRDWKVDDATEALLHRLGTHHLYVTGGPATVSEAVEFDLVSALPVGGGLSRIGGADRYEVSANVNATVFTTGETAFLASGAVFADALSGGPVAATIDAPLFLAQKDCYPESVWNGIRRYDTIDLLLLGGPNTLSESVYNVEYLC
ncbi:cell wall-binding repeat-containing protein [Herbiconiux sp. A18JL235]|uniref:Cell wall-binding repeat-containing protein n=1 Tax=Herbiconiux sp. A18JL235 TaxID=3152363 RepID=A0AB39BEL9_9MICO